MSDLKHQSSNFWTMEVDDMGVAVQSAQRVDGAIHTSTELAFYELSKRLHAGGETLARTVNAVLGFQVSSTGRRGGRATVDGWVVDLRHGRAIVTRDDRRKTDIVFYIDEDNLLDLFQGSLPPQKLLLTRKMRISGTKALQNTIHYLVGNTRKKCKL